MRPCWVVLWSSCGHLKPSCGCVGLSCGHLGAVLCRLGDRLAAVLGCLVVVLGPSCGSSCGRVGLSCGRLGAVISRLGPCWDRLRVLNFAKKKTKNNKIPLHFDHCLSNFDSIADERISSTSSTLRRVHLFSVYSSATGQLCDGTALAF